MSKRKKDSSPVVPQRDKVAFGLNIKPFNWTERQKEFISLATDKKTRVLFISGPAGSSKSLLAVFVSLLLLNEKRISDIVYLRSAVESSDSKLGYLPGDVDDKLSYYGVPFLEKLDELLPRSEVDRLQKEERISVYPINYIRGVSWNAKSIIMDEAQNSSKKELITVLTRLGQFSKCFVLADPMQSDIIESKRGGFSDIKSYFNDEESRNQGIFTFELTEDDIMRSGLCAFIVKKLRATGN